MKNAMKPPRQESTHKKTEKSHSSDEYNSNNDRASMVPALARKRSQETNNLVAKTNMTGNSSLNTKQQNQTVTENDNPERLGIRNATSVYSRRLEVLLKAASVNSTI